jgi:hypothetical protein
MSFNITGGAIVTEDTKLTDDTATVVLSKPKRTTVLSVVCTEIGGNTPNLTIEKYDGSASVYLRNALAMTAKQTFVFNEPFVLGQNQALRVTSSHASGLVDVLVNYLNPDATALGQR